MEKVSNIRELEFFVGDFIKLGTFLNVYSIIKNDYVKFMAII